MKQPIQTGKTMLKMLGGRPVALINDPPKAEPRYGYGKPSHPLLLEQIERGRTGYRLWLEQFLRLTDNYRRIGLDSGDTGRDATTPCWRNRWFPGLDAVTLYGLIACTKPARYLEIGSGFSTMFARRAVTDHGLDCRITSIDPKPRAEISSICDAVHRRHLEDVDLTVFESLDAGDILFVDGSHQLLMNSDVAVVFLEILPRLRPGVLVHFHDIWLPCDYPARWADRYYTEQYMLAALLLFGNQYDIVLPNRFITDDEELSGVLAPLWASSELAGAPRHGGSFWIKRRFPMGHVTDDS
jgi:hypothetical protein